MVVPSRNVAVPVGALKPPNGWETVNVSGAGVPYVIVDPAVVLRTELVVANPPSSTVTVRWFATARSGLPSPLKSPIATELGYAPTAKGLPEAAVNPPDPLPNSTVKSLLFRVATARAGLASPLTSPPPTE